MASIKSRLWDLFGANGQPRAIGRATVPPPDDQPTVGLPHALIQLNDARGYVGRRKDIKARNRNAGPQYRSPEVAL